MTHQGTLLETDLTAARMLEEGDAAVRLRYLMWLWPHIRRTSPF